MENQPLQQSPQPEYRPRKNSKAPLIIVGVLVTIVLALGAGFLGAYLSSRLAEKHIPETQVLDGNSVISREEADLTSVVNAVSPSVVSIVTTQTSGRGYYVQSLEGAGTGIIISADGYVLTNKHVIDGVNSVQIVASDGTRYEKVKLVGVDPLNDLAFLKIQDAKDLPAAKLGDSGTVRVGQKVIAIGNSLGQYQNTVTSGIISGVGRPVVAASSETSSSTESLTDLLQTDAAINPGNSGGPLLNASGQVIGINTAIVSGAQNIGFSIPINAAKGLIRGVLKDGTIQKAYIGVQYIAITPDIRAEYGLEEKQGALVKSGTNSTAIVKDGPADKAGLRDGDIITKVNDKIVGEQGGLSSLISEFLPGEKVTLTIVRNGKTQQLELTRGAYKAQS